MCRIFCLLIFAYMCRAVRLEREAEPSLYIIPPGHNQVVYILDVGQSKAIFCIGKNLIEHIVWYNPQEEIVKERSSNNPRIYVEKRIGDDGVIAALIIHDMKLIDGGNWTCRSGQLNDTRELVVGEKAIIVDKNVSVEGEEGKSVNLTCKAMGYPAPDVAWYKEGQLIEPTVTPATVTPRKYSIQRDHTLEIKDLNHGDKGLYTCRAMQKALVHYTEKTVQLSVQHKPVIFNDYYLNRANLYKNEEVYAILNDTKNITCSAVANPPPTYSWYRRYSNDFLDGPITDPGSVITAEDGTSSVLVFRMRDESSAGMYQCTAKNKMGARSIIFHVSLGTKPNPPDVVTLLSNNITELTFNVSCSTCVLPNEETVYEDPETVIGYSFQLVPKKEDFAANWEAATEFEVDNILDSTLHTVGPLPNNTNFHARVRSRNAAGYSDWVEISGDIATGNQWKLTSTLFVVLTSFMFTWFY